VSALQDLQAAAVPRPAHRCTFDVVLRDLAQGSPKARIAAAHALGDLADPTEERCAVIPRG